MKILSSDNAKAVDRLLRPSSGDDRRDRGLGRGDRVRGEDARRRGAARSTRRVSISLDGDLEVSRDEIEEQAARVPPKVRAALAAAARNIAKVARRQRPRGWTVTTQPGVTVEQRVTPLDRVGCYVPGGPLSSTLVIADDGDSGARRGRRRSDRRVPEARAGRHGRRTCRGRHPAVPDGRRAGHCGSRVRHDDAFRESIRSWAPATSTSPPPKRLSPRTARSTSTPARPRSSSSSDNGNPEWIAADLIAQAEHDPDARAILITTSRRLAQKVARAVAAQMPADRPGARVAGTPRRHHHRG